MGPLPGKRENPSGGSAKVCVQSMLYELENGLLEHAESSEYSNIATKEVELFSSAPSSATPVFSMENLLVHSPSNWDLVSHFLHQYRQVALAEHHCFSLQPTLAERLLF